MYNTGKALGGVCQPTVATRLLKYTQYIGLESAGRPGVEVQSAVCTVLNVVFIVMCAVTAHFHFKLVFNFIVKSIPVSPEPSMGSGC